MPVKLQEVERNYRLRNPFGMHVTSLSPQLTAEIGLKKSKV